MENTYTLIQNEIITSDISDGAYRLYSLLSSYCFGNKDFCYPGQETLSKQLHKSVRTIQRYLNELIQAGYIQKIRRGLTQTNVYKLLKIQCQNLMRHDSQEQTRQGNSQEELKDKKNYKKNKYPQKQQKPNYFKDYAGQREYDGLKLKELLLGRNKETTLSACEI